MARIHRHRPYHTILTGRDFNNASHNRTLETPNILYIGHISWLIIIPRWLFSGDIKTLKTFTIILETFEVFHHLKGPLCMTKYFLITVMAVVL